MIFKLYNFITLLKSPAFRVLFALLQNPIPTSKPGVEPKRPGRPVDITSLCRLSPTVSNHLDVSWASEFGRVSI